MTYTCHICKNKYILDDGVYVCPEGHISHHTQELLELDVFHGRATKFKTQSNFNEFKTSSQYFTKLYLKMKEYYKFNIDIPFKILLTHITNESLEYFNFNCLVSVLYLSIRIEKEKNDEIFLLRDFIIDYDYSYYQYWYFKFGNEFNIKNLTNKTAFQANELKINSLVSIIEMLGDKNKVKNMGVIQTVIGFNNENKDKLVKTIRRDRTCMENYLKAICDQFNINSNDVADHFFRACTYYLRNDKMFVPDIFICVFLYIYCYNKNIELQSDSLCFHESRKNKFEREISEMNFIEKNTLDEYLKYRREYNKSLEYKPFFECDNQLDRLRMVFTVYLNVTDAIFGDYVFYFLTVLEFRNKVDWFFEYDENVQALRGDRIIDSYKSRFFKRKSKTEGKRIKKKK